MLEINYIIILLGLIFAVILTAGFDGINAEKKYKDLKISVIIPARDEAHNISGILSDLQNQDYRIHEIICMDDGSLDDTATIARQYGAKVYEAGKLPDGWKGKPWACQQGARIAQGDVLLMIDADVRMQKDAIGILASNFEAENSCVSVQPHHKVDKAYEQLSLFFNHIQVMATGVGIPRGTVKQGLFGPVFMISKKLFFELDGYGAVKNETVEDFTLGRKYANKGVDIKLFLGGGKISFRMYPKGLASLVEGWTKNFSTGAIRTKRWLLLMIVIYMAAITAIPVYIIKSAVFADNVLLISLCAAYAVYAVHLLRSAKKLGTYWMISCIIFPIPLAAFHLIFIYSFISTFILKTTTWKGRKL